MHSLPLFTRFARYNSWRNGAIYAQSATLSDAQRRQNLSVPFGSLNGLLNHNLAADIAWMARFRGQTSPITRLDQQIEVEFAALQTRRFALDGEIEGFVAQLSEADLEAPLRWTMITRSGTMEQPLWQPLLHFFNHQTHHRGQITAVLELLGADCGVTDMLAMD